MTFLPCKMMPLASRHSLGVCGVAAVSGATSCHLDHFGSEKRFSEPFSLSTAMQILRADRLGQPSLCYAVFIFFFSAAVSAFFSAIILTSAFSHSSLVLAYTLNFFRLLSAGLG